MTAMSGDSGAPYSVREAVRMGLWTYSRDGSRKFEKCGGGQGPGGKGHPIAECSAKNRHRSIKLTVVQRPVCPNYD